MSIRSRVSRTSLLLTTGILASTFCNAESLRSPERFRAGSIKARPPLQAALAEAWASLSALWEKEGSSIDPFGQPKPEGNKSEVPRPPAEER